MFTEDCWMSSLGNVASNAAQGVCTRHQFLRISLHIRNVGIIQEWEMPQLVTRAPDYEMVYMSANGEWHQQNIAF